MNIFQRAEAYLNLTPAERALLTTIWSLLRAAMLTAGYTIGNAVLSGGQINWQSVIIVGISVGAASFADGVAKLVTASKDPPLLSPATATPKGAAPIVLPPDATKGGVPL